MARKRKFDMSKVESFKRCAEGIHTAKIVEVQENTTQAGDDMLTMAFEVIRGDSKDARVYDNFVLTDKALWKLKQLLQALGVKCDGKIVLDLDRLVGKVCDITVYHEEYNGKLKARIDEYTAIKRESSDEDDYDDDEDDEAEAEDNEPEEKPTPKKAPAKKTAAKGKKKPEPEPEADDDDDWDDDEDEEPEEKPKKKAAKPEPKKKAPTKKKADPEPEDDDDWDDDDEDWDE